MKNNLINISTIIILLAALEVSAFSQADIKSTLDEVGNESFQVFTDRNIYCAGNSILFSVYPVRNISSSYGELLSKVYYVDLISEDGRTVASGKYSLDQNGSNGVLNLSESLQSGYYIMRGYTRWMRNFSPSNFSYIPIIIVNFKSPKISRIIDFDNNFNTKKIPDILTIRMQKSIFSRDEEALMEFIVPPDMKLSDLYRITASVVRKGTLLSDVFDIKEERIAMDTKSDGYVLFPDVRGLSLSGIAVDFDGKAPREEWVYLSIPHREGELFATTMDSIGRFLFQLPYGYGEREMYLVAKNPGIKLNIDRAFASTNLLIPDFKEARDTDFIYKDVCRQISVLCQLEEIYHSSNTTDSVFEKTVSKRNLFYGEPDYSFQFSKYIDLTSTEDYFREVVIKSRIVREGDTRSFVIYDQNGSILGNNPLILIDFIPSDMETVLQLHPGRINRVDLINQTYIRGDAVFNGILSVLTHNDDFGGIEFPSNGLFFRYDLFSSDDTMIQPVSHSSYRIPDLRTTIYWNPEIVLSADKKNLLKFNTPDVPGEYQIILRTVDKNGRIIGGIHDFIIE